MSGKQCQPKVKRHMGTETRSSSKRPPKAKFLSVMYPEEIFSSPQVFADRSFSPSETKVLREGPKTEHPPGEKKISRMELWRNREAAMYQLLRTLERFNGLVLYITSVGRPSIFALADRRFEPRMYHQQIDSRGVELVVRERKSIGYGRMLTLDQFASALSVFLSRKLAARREEKARLLLRFPSQLALRNLVRTGTWKRMSALPFLHIRCQVVKPRFVDLPTSSPSSSSLTPSRNRTSSIALEAVPGSGTPWEVVVNAFTPKFPGARFVVLSLSRNTRSESQQEAYVRQEHAMEEQIRKTVGSGFLGREKFVSVVSSCSNKKRQEPIERPCHHHLALSYFRSYEDIVRWRHALRHVRTKALALPCQWYDEYEIMVTEVQEVYGFRPE